MKMHDGEIDIDVALVSALIDGQLPQLAHLPVRPVASTGTVNAIFRVGDELYARLPRVEEWAGDLDNESRWLPRLGSAGLSLQLPEPVAHGIPTSRYPLPWAIYRWIDGEPFTDAGVRDESEAAEDLAGFVTGLRHMDPAGAPRAGRRPLRELDSATREAIRAASGVIDGDGALAAWERSVNAPAWTGTPVWIHADLLRPNVLVFGGRLSAVLDWGSAGIGDPAADVIAAWTLFGPVGRDAYRNALSVDNDTWNRSRGFALHQAAMIIPYYRETNPAFVAQAVGTVEQVIAEAAS
ncbi:MAG TPA: aminoglycoside phosphotransferase family protein, partial [Glaciibacter sp.]|nr:aminoglycoside phosphotransferase family protein [Glaciibacter sp.]